MSNIKLKKSILKIFKNKIKTLNTRNLLRWKSATVCQNPVENLKCVSEN